MYMGLGLASLPIFTWSKASSVGGFRCLRWMSHSVFGCLFQGPCSVFVSLSHHHPAPVGAETMSTEIGSKSVPVLTSELKDAVSDEWSYLASGLESTSDWSGVVLYPNPRLSFTPRALQTSNGVFRPLP